MGTFVAIGWLVGPTPEYVVCPSTQSGAQALVNFSPGLPVVAGTIVTPPNWTLPAPWGAEPGEPTIEPTLGTASGGQVTLYTLGSSLPGWLEPGINVIVTVLGDVRLQPAAAVQIAAAASGIVIDDQTFFSLAYSLPGVPVIPLETINGTVQQYVIAPSIPWNPPQGAGFWVATENCVLPESQPAAGASSDSLHWALGPGVQ